MEIHNSEWKRANSCFYALANKCRMSSDDVHATIFQAFGKTHTTELTPTQLNSLCDAIRKRVLPEHEKKMDRLRKRLLGAVREYCKEMGYRTDNFYLIQVIQRGGKCFNDMTEAELMRKYNIFNKMARDLQEQSEIVPLAMTMGEA